MNTPQKKISGIFRIPFYLVSGVIIIILLSAIYNTHFSSNNLTFYMRKKPGESQEVIQEQQAAMLLADAPKVMTWGQTLNPGNIVPESGLTSITSPPATSPTSPTPRTHAESSPTWADLSTIPSTTRGNYGR